MSRNTSKKKSKKKPRKEDEDEDQDNDSDTIGGRIGPVKKLGKPDLSDVRLICFRCSENDVIFIMSPKAWQNFDPKNPSDAGLEEKFVERCT